MQSGHALPLSRRRRPLVRPGRVLLHAVLAMGALVMILPLFDMLGVSLQTLAQVNTYPPTLVPHPVVWKNYPDALTFLPFGLYLRNTLTIVVVATIGEILSNMVIAYGFARLRFPGRDVIFVVIISTMMLPGIVRLIPLYLIFFRIGWINTFYPLIVPSFFGNAFFIFLLRQFFRTIPNELSDAARIDGASELGILWRIMVPLSLPAVGTVAIFSFQYFWNDFMGPLIFLNGKNLRTLALGLYSFAALPGMGSLFNQLMAASTVVLLPILLIFALFQRWFVEGISLTGLKG